MENLNILFTERSFALLSRCLVYQRPQNLRMDWTMFIKMTPTYFFSVIVTLYILETSKLK